MLGTASRRVASSVAAVAVLVVSVSPPTGALPGERPMLEALRTSGGAVASVHPVASRIGVDVLDRGGNAIDAAVATAFALGVLRPEMTGPGGGGFMVYRSADGTVVDTLDFRETAPADITETFRNGPGIDDFKWLHMGPGGHRVVGVPGNVAGLSTALERYGTRTLTDVISPTIRIAEEGFVVSRDLQDAMALGLPYLRMFPETAKVFLHDTAISYPSRDFFGPVVDNTGDTFYLKQPDHGRMLRLIAANGPDVFYKGEIADLLVEGFEKYRHLYAEDDGTLPHLMTKADLANYRAVWRKPIRTNYRGHEIIGAPPPASGGLFVAETLNILEGFDLRAAGRSSADHLHYVTEAMKIALADRLAYIGDPDFVEVPVHKLTSKKYADQRRAEIDPDKAKIFGPAELAASRHTTHLSVIDADGNAVAMTLSLNGHFGSAVVADGTGFVLNNHLLDFDTTDVLGQPSNPQTGPNNRAAPGKRPVSASSPTIVVRHGKALMAVGASGGPTVLRGVPQVVINAIDFGMESPFKMDLARAIDAERIFPANVPACSVANPEACVTGSGPMVPDDGTATVLAAVDVLDMEGTRIAEPVKTALRGRGHHLTGEHQDFYENPVINGVGTDLATGEHLAYADQRTHDGANGEGPAVQSRQ